MHSGCHIDSDVYKSHNKSKSIYLDLFCNLFKSHFSSLDEPSKMQEICTVSPHKQPNSNQRPEEQFQVLHL